MKNLSFGEFKMITFIAHPFVIAFELDLQFCPHPTLYRIILISQGVQ